MKRLILLSLCAATVASASPTAELRAFYMQRDFDKTAPVTESTNLGGIVKYSKTISPLTVNLGYYGSYRLTGTKQGAIGTSLVQPNGDDTGFLGEANVQAYGLTVGRQRLSTPLMNDHDLRMLPSVYQGAVYSHSLPMGFTGQIGYINKYSGFASKYDGFHDEHNKWGKDGLSYVYVTGNGMNAQWVHANNDNGISIGDYGYVDYQYNLGAHYVKAQAGFNDYQTASDSSMLGLKVGIKVSDIDVALIANQINGNQWKSIESGAMFTDLQQGYGNYDPSRALGMAIGTALGALDIRLTAVKVNSSFADDYTESQADVNYQFNKTNKLRLRYSMKDQTVESNKADRNDLRVIYYLNF